jgi:hypothetical protein
MKMEQNAPQTSTALLRNASGVDAPETNSLCCAAAGIIAPLSATAEALIPYEKLREAATADTTLIAPNCLPAQPVVGCTPTSAATGLLRPIRDWVRTNNERGIGVLGAAA